MQGLPLREQFVQQAVTFLNDPRVKAADLTRAVAFLQGKGVTEAEIREAFQRCALPFPPNLQSGAPVEGSRAYGSPAVTAAPYAYGGHRPPLNSGGLMERFQGMPPPQPPPPPPASTGRPSWTSVLLGLTAAAGLYTAVREVLRLYVVPLYFPEAARAAEERIRRETDDASAQRRELSELRERVRDLCASSARTSERVEELSRSLSTSLAMREREVSTTADLRDAIRQLSHSVSMSASGGTEVAAAGAFAEDSGPSALSDASARKAGSLAYAARVDARASRAGLLAAADAPQRRSQDGLDDFMALAPAQVQESWRADVARHSITSRASMKGSSTHGGSDDNAATLACSVTSERVPGRDASADEFGARRGAMTTPAANLDGKHANADVREKADADVPLSQDKDEIKDVSSITDTGDDDAAPLSDSVVDADADAVADADMHADRGAAATADAEVANLDMGHDAELDVDDGPGSATGSRIAAARQLFESDVMAEAKHLFGANGIGDALTKSDHRPLSMPTMDPPLSELDY